VKGIYSLKSQAADFQRWVLSGNLLQALSKPVLFVILNGVKDLNLLKIRDSSLRSELQVISQLGFETASSKAWTLGGGRINGAS
jgi:hypothetical protein